MPASSRDYVVRCIELQLRFSKSEVDHVVCRMTSARTAHHLGNVSSTSISNIANVPNDQSTALLTSVVDTPAMYRPCCQGSRRRKPLCRSQACSGPGGSLVMARCYSPPSRLETPRFALQSSRCPVAASVMLCAKQGACIVQPAATLVLAALLVTTQLLTG